MDKGIDDVTSPTEAPGGIYAAPTGANGESEETTESMEDKARRGHTLFENLIEIIAKRTGDVFALGKILKEIRDLELYAALGFDTFLEFCASPELSFHKSTAYSFIQLHETFILKFGLDFQKIGNIPYSKLLTVMKYATAENVEDMIALAKELPSGDLDEEIAFRELKKTEDGQPVAYRTKGQRLFDKYKGLPAADRDDFDKEYLRWNKLD